MLRFSPHNLFELSDNSLPRRSPKGTKYQLSLKMELIKRKVGLVKGHCRLFQHIYIIRFIIDATYKLSRENEQTRNKYCGSERA